MENENQKNKNPDDFIWISDSSENEDYRNMYDKLPYDTKQVCEEKYGDKGFSEIDKSKISEVYMPIFQPIKLGFKDVSKDDWFYDDVKHVHFSGVMQGTSSETFEPLRPVIRAELSAVVNRILKIMDERFDVLDRVLAEKDELKS